MNHNNNIIIQQQQRQQEQGQGQSELQHQLLLREQQLRQIVDKEDINKNVNVIHRKTRT